MTAAVAGAVLALGAARAQPLPAPDTERMLLAHEVLEAIGGQQMMRASLRAAMGAAAQSTISGTPRERDIQQQMQRFVAEEMEQYTPELTAVSERVYARELSAAQLRDVLAFYRSPTGRALAQKVPDISRETVLELQPILAKVRRDVVVKACQLAGCTPADAKPAVDPEGRANG